MKLKIISILILTIATITHLKAQTDIPATSDFTQEEGQPLITIDPITGEPIINDGEIDGAEIDLPITNKDTSRRPLAIDSTGRPIPTRPNNDRTTKNDTPPAPKTITQPPHNVTTNLNQITDNGNRTVIVNSNKKTPTNNVETKQPNKKPFNINDLLNKKIPKKEEINSIMYTPDDLSRIQEAVDAFKNNKTLSFEKQTQNNKTRKTPTKIRELSSVYLNAILYLSKNGWIVWINGDKITAKDNDKSNPIYIKSITSKKANINWTIGVSRWAALTRNQEIDSSSYKVNENNQIELDFTLRTNQTYNLASGKVNEGRVR